MEKLLELIKELSIQEKKTLEQMALKLTEETGETAQAVLSLMKASGSEYKQLDSSDVKKECVDVILVALSIFYKLSENDTELQDMLERKATKWKAVTTKR